MTRVFKAGEVVKWDEEMVARMSGIMNVKSRYGAGPFTIEGFIEHSGHRCPECGSSELGVGHPDLIDDGPCLWNGKGDTYYRDVVVRIDSVHWLGAGWFVPALT